MLGEVAVRGTGQGARDQSLVQESLNSRSGAGTLHPGDPPSLGDPTPASSPSPLTSILENTVSVNSSALMVESLQGLMARMAWREEEVRGATQQNSASVVGEGGR